MSSPWDFADNIEKLKWLSAEGLSCSQIARRLGQGLTRNAIIGKLNRLGLSRPRPAHQRQPKPAANHPFRNKQFGNGPQAKPKGSGRARSPSASLAPPIEAVEIAIDVSDPPAAERIALLDLKPEHCRFPIDGKFCGRKTVDRGFGVYCAAHAARCYAGAPSSKPYVSKAHLGKEIVR